MSNGDPITDGISKAVQQSTLGGLRLKRRASSSSGNPVIVISPGVSAAAGFGISRTVARRKVDIPPELEPKVVYRMKRHDSDRAPKLSSKEKRAKVTKRKRAKKARKNNRRRK